MGAIVRCFQHLKEFGFRANNQDHSGHFLSLGFVQIDIIINTYLTLCKWPLSGDF